MPRAPRSRSDELPAGIVHNERPDRPERPHQFRVRDRLTNRYRCQSFSDYAKGLVWAKGALGSMERGETTAMRPLLAAIGAAYIAKLRSKDACAESLRMAQVVIDELRARGASDMSDPEFPDRVQRWLDELPGRKRKRIPRGPASARTKRKRLTIARVICHLAMKMPGRPLRYDPLQVIAIPKIERHDKPVFTVPELRRMLSESSRWRGRRVREEAEAAVAAAGGDKAKAARALGCHWTTIYNRLHTAIIEDPWWLFLALGIYTGARPAEVQSMRWEWIRWDEEAMLLPASCPGNKMKLERIIPLQPELSAILRAITRAVSAGPILPEAFTALCPADRASQFQRYVGRCGVPVDGRGPHSLRHGCGALLTACAVHPMHVMLHLGHDNMKVSHNYVRTAVRFRLDVRGWGGRFYLRDEPPMARSQALPSLGVPS